MEPIDFRLYPQEIASIYFKYPNADTFHVRFPNVAHAKQSILKSYLGCSGYHRENFDFNKYRLKLRPLYSIVAAEMHELSSILISNVKNEINMSFRQSNYLSRYNFFGWTFVQVSHVDGEIRVMTGNGEFDGEVNYALGYQYLLDKNFNMPMYFSENHQANGKTPSELGIAVLSAL